MTIQEHVSLIPFTGFHIGGPARFFITIQTHQDIEEAAQFAKEKQLPLFVLGNGTNLLISDTDQQAIVMHPLNKAIHWEQTTVTVGAGCAWDSLVQQAVEKQYAGIECLSGIPGTVGAAPVQNIGAYGQECSETLASVSAYDTQEETWHTFTKEQCHFGYRDSLFKQHSGRYIIFDVTFILSDLSPQIPSYQSLQTYLTKHHITTPQVSQIADAVREIRAEKLPDPNSIGNAGSFFKHPLITREQYTRLQRDFPDIPGILLSEGNVKLFAGWLIEQCGWKGKTRGNAGVYEKNALVLTNTTGSASAQDITEIAKDIVQSVQEKFTITLVPEVEYVDYL